MVGCRECWREFPAVASVLNYCASCICRGGEVLEAHLKQVHRKSRDKDNMPPDTPLVDGEPVCPICSRGCRPAPGEKGYCGLRENIDGRLVHLAGTPSRGLLQYYFDPLPTNCVASWVCPALQDSPRGNKNLAVFYGACTLNCLFCQNWHYRALTQKLSPLVSAESLAAKVDSRTACICFFGGDPAPQAPHALHTVRKARARQPHLKICWETSGHMSTRFFRRAMEVSYQTGGTVKFDIKALNPHLYFALTGGDNRQILENFASCAAFSYERGVTLAVASTPLVTGYITEEEIYIIASFIARHNPWTPYSLLGFHPHFHMNDLPLMSRQEAEACYRLAKEAGLRNVHLANQHLLG